MNTVTIKIDYIKLLKELCEDVSNNVKVNVIINPDTLQGINLLQIMDGKDKLIQVNYFTSKDFSYEDFMEVVKYLVQSGLQAIKKIKK